MKLILKYPVRLRVKIIEDLKDAQKKAEAFNKKSRSGVMGRLVGGLAKKSPVFSSGLYLNYSWKETSPSSLELEVIGTALDMIKGKVEGTIRSEFKKKYGKDIVKITRVKGDEDDEQN